MGGDILVRAYCVGSGVCVALTLVPWCACMGATIPLAMQAIRKRGSESERSFSYLYLANVLGALAGATVPLALIELYGFRGTLKLGAACNGLLALSGLLLSFGQTAAEPGGTARTGGVVGRAAGALLTEGTTKPLLLLFLTGLTSIGMEVVWIRQFTPYVGTVVYAFAGILAVYLVSTFTGLQIYRLWSRQNRREGILIWSLLGLLALLPLVAANPGIHIPPGLRLFVGIAPFSGVLGFVTPLLVDRFSGGDPSKAGKAYAVNVLGCILGPLASGFLLLPLLSERWVLFVFALPWLLMAIRPAWFLERVKPGWRPVSLMSWC